MANKLKKKLTLPAIKHHTEYEVGYARPPTSTRFKPGISGNPGGRPRGAKNKQPELNEERLKQIILGEAYRYITINEGGKNNSITMAEAVMRSIAVNAAKGEHRSQKMFVELVNSTEAANKAIYNEYLLTMIEYKHFWEEELERRRAYNINAPEPLPHPDDVTIDMKSGKVIIKGPMTKEEKIEWDKMLERLCDSRRSIEELKSMLKDQKNEKYLEHIKDDLVHEKSMEDLLTEALGNYGKRKILL